MNPISLRRNLHHVSGWTLERTARTFVASELDESQQKVVQHNAGALIVLAGPGTGKTATLTESVIARLAEGVRAEDILVITFARDAAAEIRNRVIARLAGGPVPTISTFHSLALSIVREFTDQDTQPKLVSAPEQEAMIRELVAGFAEESLLKSKIDWPADLAEALETRGLSVELRNALARAQTLNLRPEDIAAIAKKENSRVWQVIGPFLQVYLDTLDDMTSLDYNELVLHANELLGLEHVRNSLQNRYKVIYVDEYQDSDPLQISMLRSITTSDTCLVVVGDPDQSIYSFRGAETKSVENFQENFKHISPAPSVHFLSTSYRFGPDIRDAAIRVIDRNPIHPHLHNATGYRRLQVDEKKQSSVEVNHYRDDEHQAAEIVEKIMQLRAMHNYEWKDFAVLVRSGVRSIPTLQRALISSGIPVSTTYDEIPLADEPPVRALTFALKCAAGRLPTNEVLQLLHSGLADLSSGDTRRLARLLKQHSPELAKGAFWSEEILAEALLNPALVQSINPQTGGLALTKFLRLQQIVLDARLRIDNYDSADEILWSIWLDSKWPDRLRKVSLSSDASSSIAHHHLDSVISFFEALGTYRRRLRAKLGWKNAIEHIQSLFVPTRQVISDTNRDAVTLMSAHRSKGLDWNVVFVCSVNESVWPDLRRRTSVLAPERLTRDSLSETIDRTVIVQEERRLFYVACTRAKTHLFVSSTSANSRSDVVASRYLSQLVPGSEYDPAMPVVDTPRFTALQLVAQLRRVAADSSQPETLRNSAVERLAFLATLHDESEQLLFPEAHPDSWWGIAPETQSSSPVDEPAQPLYLRGSSLETFDNCSLMWFLQRKAEAEETKNASLSFGSIIHALADAVERGVIPADIAQIEVIIDELWPRLDFDTKWQREGERISAVECMNAFLHWRHRRSRALYGTEVDFDGIWKITNENGETEQLRLKGQADVVEISDNNGVYIIDLKTFGYAPKPEVVQDNLQLAIYQVAASLGFVTGDSEHSAAGAAIVSLRQSKAGQPIELEQSSIEDRKDWIESKMLHFAAVARSEGYEATICASCRFCRFKKVCPLQNEGKQVLS